MSATQSKWIWIYEVADGEPVNGLPKSAALDPFDSREDAEAWLTKYWRDLLANGVDQVELYEDQTSVYQMSLHPLNA
jgi:hypothetical protein